MWWLLFTGFIVALSVLLIWLFVGKTTSGEPDEYSLVPQSASGENPVAPVVSANAGAAMIVDGNDGNSAIPSPLDTLPTPTSTPAAEDSAVVNAPASRQTAAARRGTPATRSGSTSKAKDDENLLGTLLGIIKEEDKPKAKTQQPNTMDDLIAQIDADQQQRSADERMAFEQVASKKPASTESSIQAQLRRCPGANTLRGIDCRRRICSSITGKDPACPAM
ncbi:hypothetical protein [Stenotrophomonas sp. Iso1]|uniref:hypothetical protein n=1 Tax=Stenotrophomonas sp. Iso1 TaxID=2977283 RepID=UPI0022B7C413|nr:hypothetical protein [Stenotrophomonas sp. Iso1]